MILHVGKSKILTPSDVPLLLIGYSRIDFLRKRITEISQMPVKIIYVSLDGGAEVSRLEIDDFISWSREQFKSIDIFEVQVGKRNLGLVGHITSSIRRVLELHQYVVIVEDDIELSHKFYENMLIGINLQNRSGKIGIVGGFSVLNLSEKIFFQNHFRPSKYIAIWGWACSSEVWRHYNSTLRSEMFLEELSGSKSWNSLTNFQKQVWLGRFRKTIDGNYALIRFS